MNRLKSGTRCMEPVKWGAVSTWGCLLLVVSIASVGADEATVAEAVQPKLVKVYGAGGVRGLEAYQSGFLISDEGQILTAWSYVLDSDPIIVLLHDGQRMEAQLMGADPQREVAVLKIDASGLDSFDLDQAVELSVGTPVLAFSNLYGVATGDEPLSIQHGVVTAVTTLSARKGTFQSPFQGRVLMLDAMTNNAGAAGGALTDGQGRLAAVLGKELRDNLSGIWLNYAIPIGELRESVQQISQGKSPPAGDNTTDRALPPHPWTAQTLGIRLIPDVLPVTPPYVEAVTASSPAAKAPLQPDDLITFVEDRLIRSQREFWRELRQIPEHEPFSLTVQRKQELVVIEIAPP